MASFQSKLGNFCIEYMEVGLSSKLRKEKRNKMKERKMTEREVKHQIWKWKLKVTHNEFENCNFMFIRRDRVNHKFFNKNVLIIVSFSTFYVIALAMAYIISGVPERCKQIWLHPEM